MTLLHETLGSISPVLRAIRLGRSILGKQPGFMRALIYHHIAEKDELAFAKQIAFIQKKYRFIDIETFTQMQQGKQPIHGGNILLTFDDGFKSNRIIAEKYLNPLGIKAVFFILPDFIDCQDSEQQKQFVAKNIFAGMRREYELTDDLVPMNWEDIKYLMDSGHTIASHSCTHQRLSSLTAEKLTQEIVTAAEKLKNKLNVPIKHFAYPFGDIASINKEALQIAKNQYEYVFSGIRGDNHQSTHPSAIRRDHVEPTFSLRYFNFILEGGLSMRYRHKRKLLDLMV